jgi:hypothetical protein
MKLKNTVPEKIGMYIMWPLRDHLKIHVMPIKKQLLLSLYKYLFFTKLSFTWADAEHIVAQETASSKGRRSERGHPKVLHSCSARHYKS